MELEIYTQGMSEFALFSAWFTTYALIFGIIAFLVAVLTGGNVFGHSSGGLLFFFFWLFGLAATALCFLIRYVDPFVTGTIDS